MGSRHDRKRMNVEGDRLSNLPDDLIHKILSYVSIKHVVGTSVLSSRWRYIWTSMPVLNFISKDFRRLPKFNKFVKHVLSGRNDQIEVSAVELTFCGNVSQTFFKRIMKYAFSHNVQELKVACLPGKIIRSPLPAFCFTSLKSLTLTGSTQSLLLMTPSTWELPALTTLNLHYFALHDSLFSDCVNLKNLTLSNCLMKRGMNNFNIRHPGLSNLTLEENNSSGTSNVVTPQLKKLTVKNWLKIHQIIAPDLAFLQYEDGHYPLQLSTTDHLHLEKVDICIRRPSQDMETSRRIVCLLQQLHRVNFLALNLEIVKLLSSSVELILRQPSPFINLKSLKIYPTDVTAVDHGYAQPEITMSTEVKNYLLDSSPGATFTMVSYEEIRTRMNVASALKHMEDLQVLLSRLKGKSETNRAQMNPDKAPMESHMANVHAEGEVENHRAEPDTKLKRHSEERKSYIKNYWIDLNQQLNKECKNTGRIISMLQRIEEVLTRLPTLQRDKLKARFSGLCAEAETIVDNMFDWMKIRCDKKSICSNAYVHELATSSHHLHNC